MQREQTYFLFVDKVKAAKKIAWVHNEYSQLGHFKEMDLEYFEKVDKVVTISDLCAKDLKENFPEHRRKICGFTQPDIFSGYKKLGKRILSA